MITITLKGVEYRIPTAGDSNWAANLNRYLAALAAPPSFGDTTDTPGNATSNTVTGRAEFSPATNSITITNSLVTASSHVSITPLTVAGGPTDLSTGFYVTTADGSFTLTKAEGIAGSGVQFSWAVST